MSRRYESLAFGAAVLGLASWRFAETVADRDIWEHIQGGKDKIDAGAFLDYDLYSYLTDGRTFYDHDWLADVVMAFSYNLWGTPGLALLKAALALGVVAFLMWWLFRSGIEPIRAAFLGVLIVAVLTPTFGTFRPQMFTVVMFTLLLLLIVGVERGRLRWLFALPVLFVLWVNFHGGVLSGIAVAATYGIVYAVVESGRERFYPILATASSFVILGLNPNGFEHIAFLLETATVPRPEILDWQPIDLTSLVGIAYLILCVVMIGALWFSRRKLRLPVVAILVGMAVAPLVATRHLQLLAPTFVVLGAPYLAVLSSRMGGKGEPDVPVSRPMAIAMVVVMILGSGLVVKKLSDASSCIGVQADQFEFPVRAVHAMAEDDPLGNAVVTFNWGEYIFWHVGTEVQVSIDARRETIYSEEVYRANLDFVDGVGDWDRLLTMEPVDFVLIPTLSPGAGLMRQESEWEVAYEDPVAIIFVPAGSGVTFVGDKRLPVDGEGACFPA